MSDLYFVGAHAKGQANAPYRRLYATSTGRPTWRRQRVRNGPKFRGVWAKKELPMLRKWAAARSYVLDETPLDPAPHVTGDEDGLNRTLLVRLEKLANAHDVTVFILSGYRSYAEQLKLWLAYLAGTGNPANRPGTSAHEKGLAADCYIAGRAIGNVFTDSVLAKYGLQIPHSGEQWHCELL